jgi:hypothetical protein
MAKLSDKWEGNSFQGVTITTTPGTLKELFPGGDEGPGGDGKTQINYSLETEDGEFFMLYDWKYYRTHNDNDVLEFNIAARKHSTALQAKEELEEMIEDLDSTGLHYTGRS